MCCRHEKVRSLKKHTLALTFAKPHVSEVTKRVALIAESEGMKITEDALAKLHEGCNGDLRQMITQLQMWSTDAKGKLLEGKGSRKTLPVSWPSLPALNDCCVGAPGVEDRLKSGVKEVLTVNIFDTVKKIFVAGSADKGGGPSLEDRMDGFWLDTDMTPFWTCVSRPPSPVSVLCCSRVRAGGRY